MSGAPTNGVSIRSDGANLADPANYASSTQNINTEATAEVKVQVSNFGADTANGPVVIDAVGKSGGNSYHGSLYIFGRTSHLNSTDAFAGGLGLAKPPDRYIYPGATFGGPVLIPGTHFNRGKRLTFFVSAEDYVQRATYAYGSAASASIPALVPTANMRKGDFSAAEIGKYLPPGQLPPEPPRVRGRMPTSTPSPSPLRTVQPSRATETPAATAFRRSSIPAPWP